MIEASVSSATVMEHSSSAPQWGTMSRKVFDYGLLLVLVAPNLLWMCLDRGRWNTDTSSYALDALRLNHALGDTTVSWSGVMLYISSPKPPILPWVGQFFVPVGRLIGSVDVGLLLMIFIAQYVCLLFLYAAFAALFHERFYALMGCLIVASAPFFTGINKQFFVQPVQLTAVSWFIYIMVFSRKWDSAFIILQLIAASSFAMLTTTSSPAYCIVPGTLALYEATKKRKTGIEIENRHVALFVIGLFFLIPTFLWYLGNFPHAVAYGRSALNWWPGAATDGGYVQRFLYWVGLMRQGFVLPFVQALVAIAAVWASLNYWNKNRRESDRVCFGAFFALVQIVFVLVLFAMAATEVARYLLPLIGYFALICIWSIAQIDKRWVANTMVAAFLLQFGTGILNDFNIVQMWDGYWARPLQLQPDRVFTLMETIRQIAVGQTKPIVLGTGSLLFSNLDIDYYSAKVDPEYLDKTFSDALPDYRMIELMFTKGSEASAPDVDDIWAEILAAEPAYVVVMNRQLRLLYRSGSNGPWAKIVARTIEISERIAGSNDFRKAEVAHRTPELEIYELNDRTSQ